MRWRVGIVVCVLVLAGCSGFSNGQPAAYAEQARNVTPAPVPEPPTPTPTTTPPPTVKRTIPVDRVGLPPAVVSSMHRAAIGDSYTMRERVALHIEGEGLVVVQEFEYRVVNESRYLAATFSGPSIENRFNTSSVREVYWSTPNGTVRARTIDNTTRVAHNVSFQSPVLTSTRRGILWSLRFAGKRDLHADIEPYFEAFHFNLPNEARPVNESLQAVMNGERELVLTDPGVHERIWAFGSDSPVNIREVNASAVISPPGYVSEFGYSYTEFNRPISVTESRWTTYHAINTTTIPPIPDTTPQPS